MALPPEGFKLSDEIIVLEYKENGMKNLAGRRVSRERAKNLSIRMFGRDVHKGNPNLRESESGSNGQITHGLISSYTNKKCRCKECKLAWAKYNRESSYKRRHNGMSKRPVQNTKELKSIFAQVNNPS